jgi:hypothetical protein
MGLPEIKLLLSCGATALVTLLILGEAGLAARTRQAASADSGIPTPYSDGVWQSDRNGASANGQCDLSGHMLDVRRGSESFSCLNGLPCAAAELNDPSFDAFVQTGSGAYWSHQGYYRLHMEANISHTAVRWTTVEITDLDKAIRAFGSYQGALKGINRLIGVNEYRCNVPDALVPKLPD